MYFKHPEFLYFLFLLVIPIIVHLFQLRKFRKTPFTNVKFLKKVIVQTRKSSQLKKWLTLLARCLALTCLVFAFAQPFVPNSEIATKPTETVVYLDNSFSMQLEGKRGEMMKRAVQELLENFPEEKEFSLITNDQIYRNTNISQLKKDLLQLDYVSSFVSVNTVLLRAQNEFRAKPHTRKQLIAISDFQQNSLDLENLPIEKLELGLVQLTPENPSNLYIDSLYISDKGIVNQPDGRIGLKLTTLLSYTGKKPENASISLYDEEKLVAKTGIDFHENQDGQTQKSTSVELTLNNVNEGVIGKIEIQDEGLDYDNVLYFSINKPEKIKVVVLGTSDDGFLRRIYRGNNFEFLAFPEGNINYNQLSDAHTIILNGLEKIPANLIPILRNSVENGRNLAIIPSRKSDLQSYNTLTSALSAPTYSELRETEKTITEIVYEHPLFEGVFDKKVDNFQYPQTQSEFELQGFSNPILQYSDGTPFLTQKDNLFLFVADLNSENSNFKNSPLVVPVFYNIAKQSLEAIDLYYQIGENTRYDIQVNMEKDQILSIESLTNEREEEGLSFIPHQQVVDNKVQITTTDFPDKAGVYVVKKDETVLKYLSYNYPRNESDLRYADISQLQGVKIGDNVGEFLVEQQQQNQIDELWKWFVIFAVGFLMIEVLLLRFLK